MNELETIYLWEIRYGNFRGDPIEVATAEDDISVAMARAEAVAASGYFGNDVPAGRITEVRAVGSATLDLRDFVMAFRAAAIR